MKIVLTGGGTGGHIYPALAIADKFKEHYPDAEFLYIGDKNCMESTIVPAAGYEFKDVPAEEVNRRNVFKLAKTAYKNILGISKAKKIMRAFGADVVIGTGGFVSFPVIYAGHKIGAKCYLHEENAFPGLANRTLERYVNKLTLGFEAAKKFFKQPEKLVVTGNPVRSALLKIRKDEARKELGIDPDDFVILSFGGSLGADRINEVVYENMKELNGKKGFTLLFGTGRKYYDGVAARMKEEGFTPAENVRVKPYLEEMDLYLGAADLVICRSGAVTVAETGALGKASIFVPSPNVTGNHQYYNAKAVADRGGAVLIEEKDLTAALLSEQIRRFSEDREALREMGRKAKELAPGNVEETIMNVITGDINA